MSKCAELSEMPGFKPSLSALAQRTAVLQMLMSNRQLGNTCHGRRGLETAQQSSSSPPQK